MLGTSGFVYTAHLAIFVCRTPALDCRRMNKLNQQLELRTNERQTSVILDRERSSIVISGDEKRAVYKLGSWVNSELQSDNRSTMQTLAIKSLFRCIDGSRKRHPKRTT